MALTEGVGERVRELRERRGFTQAFLAEAARITSDEVSRIERGAREPKFQTLERLAGALQVPVVELFASRENRVRRRPVMSARLEQLSTELDQLDPKTAEALLQGWIATTRALQRAATRTRGSRTGR